MTHRMATRQRRHVERLERTAPGLIVLGDAICSFNPVYGQGMTSAALQAVALDRCLARHGVASPKLARNFYRRAAKVVDVPWRIAAGADFADPRTTGSRPIGTDAANRYLERVALACHVSAAVNRRVSRVQHLLARPASLLYPTVVARVLWASRRSPAHPRRSLTKVAASTHSESTAWSSSITISPEFVRATQGGWAR
jgi:2-polyprenyl-6-methoxyphenol hydroxylase-like FAD-dependent oxidoreductase